MLHDSTRGCITSVIGRHRQPYVKKARQTIEVTNGALEQTNTRAGPEPSSESSPTIPLRPTRNQVQMSGTDDTTSSLKNIRYTALKLPCTVDHILRMRGS
ncbi:hypothetical protein E2C01_036944 [Portunus trituberculatus]|uniref:Uncharacterized protein n=1 Tax=Portunus trituberculatus TaxID=210409 RepID=A0A5B7F6T9_PORTR|nr:hypothetical protein [Portunus trituberculatus]